MKKVLQVMTAALALAVPVSAVWALAPQAGEAVASPEVSVAVGDAAAVTPAVVKATKAGEMPAEVLAREWTATGGGGKRPKPSPKG